jgi:L-ascorbate metabolism protein UlaG (beta-lactamase superfamily)
MSSGSISITWYGHACVELVTPGGLTVLFDPWFGNPTSPKPASDVERCDVLLVTHGHHDHLGAGPGDVRNADALAIARRTHPIWPCIHEMSLWLGDRLADGDAEVIGFNKGGTVDARGLKVTMVHADHSAGDWSAEGEGPLYLGEPAGFIVELEDRRRIYFAGDTDAFGDLRLIADQHAPSIAFLPIGGHYTMGPRNAALAAELVRAEDIIPIHYGTFPVLAGTPDQLRQELAARGREGVRVHAPERGATLQL